MSDLPNGWIKTKLEDVLVDIDKGDPAKLGIDPIEYIDIGSVDSSTRTVADTAILAADTAPSRARQIVKLDDVLFSTVRPYLKRIARIEKTVDNLFVSTGFTVIRAAQSIDKKYLYYIVNSEEFISKVNKLARGASYPAVRDGDVKAQEIVLPPANEQKRIVKKLDTIFEQLNETKTRLNRVPDVLKKFRRSVLEAACTGKLTSDWRKQGITTTPASKTLSKFLVNNRIKDEKYVVLGKEKKIRFKEPVEPDLAHWDKKIPKSWAVVSVSQFAECLDSIRCPIKKEKRKVAKGLYPYFGANGEVGKIDEYIFDDTITLVTEDETFYGRTKPVAYLSKGKCWVNNHAHVLRSYSPIATEYLCYSLMFYHVIPWLSGTTGRAKLTQEDLLKLPIAVPPEEELPIVVDKIRSKLIELDSYLQSLSQLNVQLNQIESSVLARAFEGRLVNQDPSDEPASTLLARIQTDQEAAKTKKKKKIAKKKTNRKKRTTSNTGVSSSNKSTVAASSTIE